MFLVSSPAGPCHPGPAQRLMTVIGLKRHCGLAGAHRAEQQPLAPGAVRGGIEERVYRRRPQRRPRAVPDYENPVALLRRATVPRTQPSAGQWNMEGLARPVGGRDLGRGGETKPGG